MDWGIRGAGLLVRQKLGWAPRVLLRLEAWIPNEHKSREIKIKMEPSAPWVLLLRFVGSVLKGGSTLHEKNDKGCGTVLFSALRPSSPHCITLPHSEVVIHAAIAVSDPQQERVPTWTCILEEINCDVIEFDTPSEGIQYCVEQKVLQDVNGCTTAP